MHTIGDRLADRALEAARRQNDNRWMLAMLREQGQLALDHNDRAAAEAVWTRMLNMVVAPEPAKRQSARPNRPAAAPARVPVTKPAPAPAKTTTPASGSHTGLLKSRSFSACALIAMLCCAISPPCEGGVGGVVPAITSDLDRSGGPSGSALAPAGQRLSRVLPPRNRVQGDGSPGHPP